LAANLTFGAMSAQTENFVVSARKYRPETWSQVIGQGSITETLDNSIRQNHLAHAYLFCGPRGVGKTTCARIFAKEINRSEEHKDDEDFSFNIFELDAASNNGVDEMRALTDQVRIPPQVGKYKVYIIDEVHMLSKAAFNAFLKTLEEPPKHAIFILATTEKHKIIPTILSRCQIYDFNRITVEAIVEQLKHIASKEGINYEEEALHVIAQKADGAMRDALSIFDQLASFTNEHLTYADVLKNLHVLDYDYYFKITDLLFKQAYSEAILMLDEILKQGFDGAHFIGGLASHLRDLLVCQHPKTVGLLEVGKTVQEEYLKQASATPAEWLTPALPIITEAEFKYRNAPNTRLLIEVTLLKLSSLGGEKKNDQREPLLREPEQPTAVPSATTQPKATTAPDSPAETPSAPKAEPETEPVQKPDAPITSDEPTKEPVEQADEASKLTPPEEQQPTERRPELKQRKRRTTAISLDDDDEGTTESADEQKESETLHTPSIQEIAEETNIPVKPLEPKEAWKHLCEVYLSEGKNALYSIMAKQDMQDQFSDSTFTVYLSHEVDQEEFNHHSTDLLHRLRNLSSNKELQLQTEIKETKTATKLFTTQEKYEHLVNKNPNLEQFKRDLDLDFL
jgi:DNA polymerase III subunit gamma/tau